MIYKPEEKLENIRKNYSPSDTRTLMKGMYQKEFPGRIALVSSFGAESVILLYFAAEISPDFPVIFIDTKKLFPETIEYRDILIKTLGLKNVKTIYPDYNDIARHDPDGSLWQENPKHCCTIRKVIPLEKALKNYDAWVTGRKRYHGGMRSNLPFIERSDGNIKVNPLVEWNREKIEAFLNEKKLPKHKLISKGYSSIGCAPCTEIPSNSEDARSGRWAGQEKTECGIHLGEDGKFYSGKID